MFNNQIIFLSILLLLTNSDYSHSECQGEICLRAEPTEPIVQQPILPPIKVGGKTYYVETFFQANWYRANQFCRHHNMQLASISNQEENNKLLGELEAAYGLELHFWTSGNDLAINGTFFWLSTGADFQFTDWYAGEPNHLISGDEIEHCVEIRGSNGTLSWNDKVCSFEAYIICEI